MITLGYLGMDYSVDRGGAFRPGTAVTTAAIVIAMVKARVILREFMEVRHAPALLTRLADAWVVIIAVSLLGSYFIGLRAR